MIEIVLDKKLRWLLVQRACLKTFIKKIRTWSVWHKFSPSREFSKAMKNLIDALEDQVDARLKEVEKIEYFGGLVKIFKTK